MAEGEPPYLEYPPLKVRCSLIAKHIADGLLTPREQALFMIAAHGSPQLKEPEKWSNTFHHFMERCLDVNAPARASAQELLKVQNNSIKSPDALMPDLLGLCPTLNSILFCGWHVL